MIIKPPSGLSLTTPWLREIVKRIFISGIYKFDLPRNRYPCPRSRQCISRKSKLARNWDCLIVPSPFFPTCKRYTSLERKPIHFMIINYYILHWNKYDGWSFGVYKISRLVPLGGRQREDEKRDNFGFVKAWPCFFVRYSSFVSHWKFAFFSSSVIICIKWVLLSAYVKDRFESCPIRLLTLCPFDWSILIISMVSVLRKSLMIEASRRVQHLLVKFSRIYYEKYEISHVLTRYPQLIYPLCVLSWE